MARRLFTFAASVSFILLLVSVSLWACAMRYEIWAFANDRRGGRAVVYAGHGAVSVAATHWPRSAWKAGVQRAGASSGFTPSVGYPSGVTPVVRHYIGVQVIQLKGWLATPDDPVMFGSTPALPLGSVNVPLLLPTLLAGALPLTWLGQRVLRGRKPPPGLCPACRYDLTGNTSGVCPECGLAVRAGTIPPSAGATPNFFCGDPRHAVGKPGRRC